MRLLHTSHLTIHAFEGVKIPKYTILSHTWEKDEVTFQEMINPTEEVRAKAGYKKIQAACKVAQTEYIWIDTCCIDKTSSAELSEAINSMYEWYEDSLKCIAYLSDFNLERYDVAVSKVDISTTFFRDSRWFTRGWCLQELLAPPRLVFYSAEWQVLGSRWHLRDQISLATGIEIWYLHGYSKTIQEASVATRLSWAAARETTRVEDRAYCLMGLFGVHIPLLYGEGRRAFRRLQEEIVKRSNDQTIFAWHWEDHENSWNSIVNQGISSILADDPVRFASSGKLVPYQKWIPDEPYVSTNLGIRITVPLAERSPNKYYAALGCHEQGDLRTIIAISVTESSNNVFVRDSPKIFRIDRLEWRTTEIREIHIRTEKTSGMEEPRMGSVGVIIGKIDLPKTDVYLKLHLCELSGKGRFEILQAPLLGTFHPPLQLIGLSPIPQSINESNQMEEVCSKFLVELWHSTKILNYSEARGMFKLALKLCWPSEQSLAGYDRDRNSINFGELHAAILPFTKSFGEADPNAWVKLGRQSTSFDLGEWIVESAIDIDFVPFVNGTGKFHSITHLVIDIWKPDEFASSDVQALRYARNEMINTGAINMLSPEVMDNDDMSLDDHSDDGASSASQEVDTASPHDEDKTMLETASSISSTATNDQPQQQPPPLNRRDAPIWSHENVPLNIPGNVRLPEARSPSPPPSPEMSPFVTSNDLFPIERGWLSSSP